MSGSSRSRFLFVQEDTLPIEWAEDSASAPAAPVLVTSGSYQKERARAFSSASSQALIFNWFVPTDIVATAGIKFRVSGIAHAATPPASGEGVAFVMSGYSRGQGDAGDGTPGSEVTVTIADLYAAGVATQYDHFITDWSGTVTITDLAGGEKAVLYFYRDHDHASDDYGQDISVTSVTIQYTRKTATS